MGSGEGRGYPDHEGFLTRASFFPGRYNCKEEFQIHEELLKAHYTLGRLSDATPEHYLVQVRSARPLPPPSASPTLLWSSFLTGSLLPAFPTCPFSLPPFGVLTHFLSPPGFLGPHPLPCGAPCLSLLAGSCLAPVCPHPALGAAVRTESGPQTAPLSQGISSPFSTL